MINEVFYLLLFFPHYVFKTQGARYVYSTLFIPVTFQGLNSHVWPVATVLDRTDMDILAN